MELFDLVRQLCVSYGPSGSEEEIRRVLQDLARPFADEIITDTLGNLIVHKRGPGPRVMFSAHMDSIGLMVTHIEKEGFLRVGRVGGISPQKIAFASVRFQNGVRGTIVPEEKAAFEKLTLDECYLDIGASDDRQAKAAVQVGDIAVYDSPAFLSGEHMVSPYLDDRAACAVLISALERIEQPVNDLYFVFSVQEEVGCRGAKTAAWALEPDYGLAVDVTDVNDTPGGTREGTTKLGSGAGVKIMDRSVISHPCVVEKLEQAAKVHQIPVQRDIMRAGGTDAGAIHLSREGVRSGGISIPCRYVHTPAETAHQRDLDACIRLVAAFAQTPLER